jgi:hypothetical protein
VCALSTCGGKLHPNIKNRTKEIATKQTREKNGIKMKRKYEDNDNDSKKKKNNIKEIILPFNESEDSDGLTSRALSRPEPRSAGTG